MFTFGVELECYPRDLDHCVPTLVSGTYKERTLKSLYERCSHSERRPEFLAPSGHKWLISKDGSLRDGGAEFVSSPYREDEIPVFISDLQWFRDVIQITTDQSCGGHIHISWDELPLMRQGDRFGLFYNLLENMSKIEQSSRLRACLQKMDRYIDLLRNPSWTEQEAYDRIYG